MVVCVVGGGAAVKIALVTEGTYPTSLGGVSVWCDQLTRGLPEHVFDVFALVGTGTERAVWKVPDNVGRFVKVPLWGQQVVPRASRSEKRRFAPVHRNLLDVLVSRKEVSAAQFLDALRELFEFSQRGSLSAALNSDESFRRLGLAWRFACARRVGRDWTTAVPSMADVLIASQLLEHFLRPFSDPPRDADLSHCSSNGLGVLAAMAAKWECATPFILSEHGVYLREQYLGIAASSYRDPVRGLLLRFMRLLTAAGYAAADLIAPGSRYNCRWAVRNGADDEKVRPIYNGVDPEEYPTTQVEPTQPTVSWVGRMDPIKDVETLLRAFAVVRDVIPNARLRMFGPTPAGSETYRASCDRLRSELQLTDAVTFEGRVPSVVDAYHAGHIVALTSVSEGFPYSVIEAMASGRTVVATDVGGVSEAVSDTGLLAPARDHQAVGRACIKLLTDHGLRWRLAGAARERALQSFTLQRSIQAYRTLYLDVATGTRQQEPIGGEPVAAPARAVL